MEQKENIEMKSVELSFYKRMSVANGFYDIFKSFLRFCRCCKGSSREQVYTRNK